MSQKLLSEFKPIPTSQWEEVITKDLKGADYEKKLIWKTQEGISVRPYYRAEDLEKLQHLKSAPGKFPFVRGTKEDNHWLIRQGYCAWEGYSRANAQALDGIKKGVESVGFCIDGNKAISPAEMSVLLRGINLEKFEINFEGCESATPQIISSFIEHAKSTGANPGKVAASFDFDPLRTLTVKGHFCCENYKEMLKQCVELVAAYPLIRVVNVEAYAFNDAGSTLVQESAFGMAAGSEYMNILTEMGFTPDEVASRIKFTYSVGSSYFMEIAKFRALRVIWANIVKEYGVSKEENQKICMHAVTSQWNLTVYDSYVNMLRSTTEAMSAAIAGVHSMEVLPFDYAFRQPGEFSNRIARNIQIILKEESHFDKVTDPSAGSYYVETLTNSLGTAAWDLFKLIEEKGGYTSSFMSGYIQSEIKTSSAKKDQNIATRRDILLGTNQYPNFKEKAEKDITEKVVTRGYKEINDNQPKIAEPLEKYRGAQAFEALRYATEKSGRDTKVFMLTFGNLAMCRARAQFSSNFFSVAGFSIIDNNRFSSVEEGINAALESKADFVVACSSDEEYAEAVPQIAAKLAGKSTVVVAGDPACKDELAAKGIDKFINVRSNVLETLKSFQKLVGINQ